jgi:hypothetical protein
MSRVALLSCYTDDYKPLADLTWVKNKALYCAKYNYTGYNIGGVNLHKQGFTKFNLARSVLDHHEWIWITGTDSLITNFTKDVYDVLDLQNRSISFVAAFDVNGLNADSVLFRNDVAGRTLLDAVEAHREIYDNEQHTTVVLTQENPYWRNRTKIVYQWELNSYLYGLYPAGTPTVDSKYGERGEWSEGDLLIHWPGMNLEKRMQLANEYLGRVIT